MLLPINIFLTVCVCVVVLITRELIYNKTDHFFKKYIGIVYLFGIFIQINIGFIVNYTDLSLHYFYLFPVEIFFLSIIYEFLIAKSHYNKRLSLTYALVSVLLTIIYFAFIYFVPKIESYWTVAQSIKTFFVICIFAQLFKNYIYIGKKYRFKEKQFALRFVSLLIVCFYVIFILVGLLLNQIDIGVVFVSKTVFCILTIMFLSQAIYDYFKVKKELNVQENLFVEVDNATVEIDAESTSLTITDHRVQEKSSVKKYEKSRLKAHEIEKIKLAIDDELIVNKAYLNPDLSLQKLSNKLNITSHNISQVFNLSYQSNFKDYVNKLRCDYAVKLLKDSSEKHIIEIAYESGFNSKTSFYRAFNKNYNVNPTEYKLILDQKKQF